MDFDFDNDDDLDEQTLAALDDIEASWKQKHAAPPVVEPPAKRQKTESGWRSVAAASSSASFDLDELPEISLCQNSYTFGLGSPSLTPQASTSKSLNVPPKPPIRSSAQSRPFHRNQSARSARLLEQITLALAEPSQPSGPQNITPPPPTVRPVQPVPIPPPPPPPPPEIDEFKKQLEEMRLENERIQAALREAEDARIAKIGEVAVLRRGIQKTAEDHAAQMSKLKAAKDEADTKQAAMQRDLKEEMERLKTQFIFKQHELESTSRKPPMSAHGRRNVRDLPSSTQTPFWGNRVAVAGPSSTAFVPPESTPVKVLPPAIRPPKSPRKSAMLPGFENSFLESTPKRQLGKEKAHSPEIHRPLFENELQSRKLPVRAQSSFPDDGFGMEIDVPPIPKQRLLPSSSPTPNDDEDVEMEEEDEEDGDESVEVVHFNWKAELTRIVLTHTHPSYSRPTLQFLAEQSTAVASPEDYSSHISRILEVIASTSINEGYDRAISVLTRCFVSMAIALNLSNLISPLIPLLNLLSTLIYSLPSFNMIVFLQCFENDNNPSVLVLLCNVIKQQLAVTKHSHDTPLLASETLSLAEALCWRTPEDRVEKLDIVARDQEVLMTLLNNSQPCWFLNRATRLLALMSIYPHLACSLLSLPAPELEEGENQRVFVPKIPQLDRLCSFLIDGNRRGEESIALKENVVTLLVVLSQAHPDALAALTSSNGAIPSLILYLTNMSSPIWEEDESLLSSPSTISSTIKSLNQTMYLLHYLVFSVQPEVGLRMKLQNSPQRPFNGIIHMFTVTFGRLSYAPMPEWIDPDEQYELSAIREMAKDLLELVVDGPEGDSIYLVHHDEDVDEVEMEEQLLGDS